MDIEPLDFYLFCCFLIRGVWESLRERILQEFGLPKDSGPRGIGRLLLESFSEGISVSSFCAGVRHGGQERYDFLIFISRLRQDFAAPNIPWIRAFDFNRDAIAHVVGGAWVASRQFWGIGVGGHCWRERSTRDA